MASDQKFGNFEPLLLDKNKHIAAPLSFVL